MEGIRANRSAPVGMGGLSPRVGIYPSISQLMTHIPADDFRGFCPSTVRQGPLNILLLDLDVQK